MLIEYAYLALGGVIGTFLRYWLYLFSMRWLGAAFPYAIITCNWLGSFLIALLGAYFIELFQRNQGIRLLFMVGLLGSFTTFSTFSLDNLHMLKNGQYGLSLLYTLSSVLGGIGLAALGWWLGEYLRRPV